MKRSRFMEEQIIGVLKEHQAGLSATLLCRKHGITDAGSVRRNRTRSSSSVLFNQREDARTSPVRKKTLQSAYETINRATFILTD